VIVNLRGTNGAGKSAVAMKFIQSFASRELYGRLGPRRPEAYAVDINSSKPLYVLGPYQTATGGIDAAGLDVAKVIELATKYCVMGHVFFEGVVISTTFGAVGTWLAEKHKEDSIVAYLDTPLEVCLDGVEARGGNRKALHIATKHKVIERTMALMIEAGVRTEMVSRDNAFKKIIGWLR
jgi:hypothetical protein